MKKIIHMLSVLGVVGLLSGLSLAYVHQACNDRIKANEKARLDTALSEVVPGAKKFEKKKTDNIFYYIGRDEADEIIGYGCQTKGSGYQGEIKLIFGLGKDTQTLTGLVILPPCDETPGLGGKIVEEDFRDQFKNLNFEPRVVYVKGKKPEKQNEIEAITGATISSAAVVRIVNDGLWELLKELGVDFNNDAVTGATK